MHPLRTGPPLHTGRLDRFVSDDHRSANEMPIGARGSGRRSLDGPNSEREKPPPKADSTRGRLRDTTDQGEIPSWQSNRHHEGKNESSEQPSPVNAAPRLGQDQQPPAGPHGGSLAQPSPTTSEPPAADRSDVNGIHGIHPDRLTAWQDQPADDNAATRVAPGGIIAPAGPRFSNDRSGRDKRFAQINSVLQGSGERGASIRGRASGRNPPPLPSPTFSQATSSPDEAPPAQSRVELMPDKTTPQEDGGSWDNKDDYRGQRRDERERERDRDRERRSLGGGGDRMRRDDYQLDRERSRRSGDGVNSNFDQSGYRRDRDGFRDRDRMRKRSRMGDDWGSGGSGGSWGSYGGGGGGMRMGGGDYKRPRHGP